MIDCSGLMLDILEYASVSVDPRLGLSVFTAGCVRSCNHSGLLLTMKCQRVSNENTDIRFARHCDLFLTRRARKATLMELALSLKISMRCECAYKRVLGRVANFASYL